MADRPSAVRLIRSPSLYETPYAAAATVAGPTRPIHVAGACPLDPAGAVVAPGDVAGQARQCLANLRTALADAAARIEDVIYTRVLVATADRDDLVDAWSVVQAAFGAHDVPSTLHGVTVLGYPGQLVEIEAVAAVPV